MAKEKATIALDRDKAGAPSLVGLESTSVVVDFALDRLTHLVRR
ncbi:MAG TPA: hypothetical protein VFH58_10685 [Acidimicrobiales bacterium]|nr:hypothetical protein [Acidimicrobiales bacterium]